MKSRYPITIMVSLFFCAVLAGACSSTPRELPQGGERASRERIAVFPFENLTEEPDALEKVMPVLRARLEGEGFELVDEKDIEAFFLRERVRVTGSISKEVAQKLAKELNAQAVMLGAVSSFSVKENPQAGLVARLVDPASGRVVWANSASVTGEDFTKILGLGTVRKVEDLVPKAVDRLLASFGTAPSQKEAPYRVAVMPFRNRADARDAGAVVTYMFLTEVFKSPKFEVVEYGDIRKTVIDARITARGELDYKNIEALASSLGVDGVVIGTVERYSESLDVSLLAEVGISVRLVDARTKRIVWYDSRSMKGDDAVVILDWGRMRSADKVAGRIVTALVGKMERVHGIETSNR